ncbi:MAG: hypothetical protein U1E76_18325 [Planctomycetota bacterium]
MRVLEVQVRVAYTVPFQDDQLARASERSGRGGKIAEAHQRRGGVQASACFLQPQLELLEGECATLGVTQRARHVLQMQHDLAQVELDQGHADLVSLGAEQLARLQQPLDGRADGASQEVEVAEAVVGVGHHAPEREPLVAASGDVVQTARARHLIEHRVAVAEIERDVREAIGITLAAEAGAGAAVQPYRRREFLAPLQQVCLVRVELCQQALVGAAHERGARARGHARGLVEAAEVHEHVHQRLARARSLDRLAQPQVQSDGAAVQAAGVGEVAEHMMQLRAAACRQRAHRAMRSRVRHALQRGDELLGLGEVLLDLQVHLGLERLRQRHDLGVRQILERRELGRIGRPRLQRRRDLAQHRLASLVDVHARAERARRVGIIPVAHRTAACGAQPHPRSAPRSRTRRAAAGRT